MNQPYYWNRDNFEGLASLAQRLRSNPRLELLARYCELREKGVRKQAFAALDEFLALADSWPTPVRREIALIVVDEHWRVPESHQFLAEPLRRRFIEPVFKQWREAEPENAIPARYLGLLLRDRPLLDDALRLNPNDDDVRIAIAGMLIAFVEHETHHLVESRFIGDEKEAAAALSEAANLLSSGPDSDIARSLKAHVQYLRTMLADWSDYQRRPIGSFPEWRRNLGRDDQWWSIVYYESS